MALVQDWRLNWSTSAGNSLYTASAWFLQRILRTVCVVFSWPQLHRNQSHEISSLPPGTITSKQQSGKPYLCAWSTVHGETLVLKLWMLLGMICICSTNPCSTRQSMRLVSKSAITALSHYLWYLTTDMVPLALFSDLTPSDGRHTLAERLLSIRYEHGDIHNSPRDRFGTGCAKPHFQLTSPNLRHLQIVL